MNCVWGRAPRKTQVVARAADAVGGGKYADDVAGADAGDFQRKATRLMRLFEFVCGIEGGRNSGRDVVRERKSRATVAEIAARHGERYLRRACATGPGTCDSRRGYCSAAFALQSPFFFFGCGVFFVLMSKSKRFLILLTRHKNSNGYSSGSDGYSDSRSM